ncbi:cob(I)yrinic acid a,c-diamide adenosyltransferase [Paenibacillus sp. FSL W8-0187]|uniref:Corrinoid adenosyltransferase n=1 Tax=Paenibacillus lautus TaxID=1401 RepID=A0A1R1AWC3_PAELA|nr:MULTISPECIES: cob(I)yrinic acid a,c-diamide adenosyltransferase [Paenibacillus]MBT2762607.1 cob(I)yrinic acid a,c-diamide adenosyltransferase [Paenibacillus sp. ISL-20]OME89974.1 ATP:cob(I)alamin adenosyltransferase [Paenibacillus lautus]
MKVYTRTGDAGETSIIGGRVPKDDPRIEAYGTIDELNSFVGQAVFLAKEADFEELHLQLVRIQHELFDCGSDLAYARPREDKLKVGAELVDNLEVWLDAFEEKNPPLERFILPGGSALSSLLHVCRTVCRRAERLTVSLQRTTEINPEVRRYLNRLSDYFFVTARAANVHAGIPDVEYERSGKVFR